MKGTDSHVRFIQVVRKGIPILAILALFSLTFTACKPEPKGTEEEVVAGADSITIVISPTVPSDIFTNGTPASKATLTQAAMFAWQEFIALNWPAQSGFRDSANIGAHFGEPSGTLVWHTFRAKVEIYPGNGQPPPGYDSSSPDFGYNTPYPQYFYKPSSVGTNDGQITPCGDSTPAASTPWINLDEKNEIGQATMFAGINDSTQYPSQQILFLAKANKSEYIYAAKNKWYGGGAAYSAAQKKTVSYIQANKATPPPDSGASLVSLPYGTIEIKTAWRRLTTTEAGSGRFYTTKVRYYDKKGEYPCYIDETWGMVALHIIHKTPTAPYFIFATFGQTDNILTAAGDSVEDANGNIVVPYATPFAPNITSVNAGPHSNQKLSPKRADSIPGKRLYFQNTITDTLATQGTVCINGRANPIPADVINVNAAAHKAIAAYNEKNKVTSSPWLYYKLVNVQYKPMTKATPGEDYTEPDSATYYQANIVVESDYVLQKFSGRFGPSGTSTDFTSSGTVYQNVYYGGNGYLMGGCMGCHGNATNFGSDFSFILGFPVAEPEFASPVTGLEPRLRQLRAFLQIQ